MQRELDTFVPPHWSKGLKSVPEKRFKFSQTPTPIHKWDLSVAGFEISIKRDDLTGAALSGNKVRKLDFILAKAVEQKCDCVITIGIVQSNHARATAVAARQVGLDSHLILLPKSNLKNSRYTKPEDAPVSGNLLLDRLVGANVYLESTYTGDRFEAMSRMMTSLSEKLRSEKKIPYIINVGGTGAMGVWSYIEAFQEMVDQGVLDRFDDIIVPISSGGTPCGIAVGNYLLGSKLKIHAVLVVNTVAMMYRQMNEELTDLGLADENGQPVRAEDIVEVIDGYADAITSDDMALLSKISSSTGIILDTTFTLKAVKGMLCEMEKNPTRFKGCRVLFVHTGGMFGIMNGILDEVLLTTEETNRIKKLSDVI